MTNGHPNGNGHIRISRTMLAVIGILLGVLAWAFDRYDTAIDDRIVGVERQADSLGAALLRFQVRANEVLTDHESRLPPRPLRRDP